jgi:hypothetical protein
VHGAHTRVSVRAGWRALVRAATRAVRKCAGMDGWMAGCVAVVLRWAARAGKVMAAGTNQLEGVGRSGGKSQPASLRRPAAFRPARQSRINVPALFARGFHEPYPHPSFCLSRITAYTLIFVRQSS